MVELDNVLISRRVALMEQPVDDEMFGLEPEAGDFYGFNASAARIWALIEQPRSLDSLCDALAEEFDVAPAEARGDTLLLLRTLESDGLITLSPING